MEEDREEHHSEMNRDDNIPNIFFSFSFFIAIKTFHIMKRNKYTKS